MNVIEIFDSIDGEGVRAGELATFIRLAGCNLRCSYCDTPYALSLTSPGEHMSVERIVDIVSSMRNHNVTVTGGEPLLTDYGVALIHRLCKDGYSVNVETNGSLDIGMVTGFENCIVTMDWKTPSSGAEDEMYEPNLRRLRTHDVLKFVCGATDLPAVFDLLMEKRPDCWVYLSPVFGKIAPAALVDFMKELRAGGFDMSKTRVQLQMHKYIWEPSKRGV